MAFLVMNRTTGLAHEVPAGHPALTDGNHDVIATDDATTHADTPVATSDDEQPSNTPRARRRATTGR